MVYVAVAASINALADLEAAVGVKAEFYLLPYLQRPLKLFLGLLLYHLAQEYAPFRYVSGVAGDNLYIAADSKITFRHYAEHSRGAPVFADLYTGRPGNHRTIGGDIIKRAKSIGDIGIAGDRRDYLVVVYDWNLVAKKGEWRIRLRSHDKITGKAAHKGSAHPLVGTLEHSVGKKQESHTQGYQGA